MEEVKQKKRNITNYRKDFTPEEKAEYNAYVVSRMKVYFKTDKGKEVAARNTKNHLEKKKLEKTSLIKAN